MVIKCICNDIKEAPARAAAKKVNPPNPRQVLIDAGAANGFQCRQCVSTMIDLIIEEQGPDALKKQRGWRKILQKRGLLSEESSPANTEGISR